MKDMVSIRKMQPVSPATILGIRAEGGVSRAAAMAALSAEVDGDFFRGDNRVSLAAGMRGCSPSPHWKSSQMRLYSKLIVKSASTNLVFMPPSELLKTR